MALGSDMMDHWELLETYKELCYQADTDGCDIELYNIIENKLGESIEYFNEQKGTAEQQDKFEDICNKYNEKLFNELDDISSFEEAKNCWYMMNKDRDYASFIEQGLRLEQTITKLETLIYDLEKSGE